MENLPLAVTGYQLSVWIHITAVVVGLGMTFAEAVLFPVAMKLDPRHLPYVHRLQLTINRYVASPALLLILVTGIYQVSDGNWDFGSFWISATFAVVILIGGINGAYFIPADKRLEAMITGEIEAAGPGEFTPSEEYMRQARIEGIIGAVTGILIIISIYLMVVKPGA
ncbi:MAG: DUF2269 family protein [Solirubrobacterales bacterium]|nr:DUF2269 family protein [Solirubrobacterales bacterium]MCB0860997.1 DUF2269 family protein [Solirubrobacterales bacterium]HRV59542.1 DUF2269 family protein [Solirubrobacterales bacterium]